MTPFFSIIVPVYKAEPYLRQCVDSILAQTYADFELILVDDGSPDGCGAICDGYAAGDSRVRVLHQPNAGPSPARRNGLNTARGSYICFVDADDWVLPRWLETIKGRIDQNGQPDVILFDHVRDDGPSSYKLFAKEGCYDRAGIESELFPWMLCDVRRRPIGTQLFPGFLWNRAIKRELLAAHYLTDDRIDIFEDSAMSYDCVRHALSVYIIHQPLYTYRRTETSNLKHYRPDYFQQLKMVQDYMLATLGDAPYMDRQISGFVIGQIISGVIGEYRHQNSVHKTARAVGGSLRQTGLMKAVSAKGMPLYIRLYVLLFKCRLYHIAVLVTLLRLSLGS